jgi:hypothetical protein
MARRQFDGVTLSVSDGQSVATKTLVPRNCERGR